MKTPENVYSRLKYRLPVVLPEYVRFPSSPEHKGNFEHAEDIAVPDPRQKEMIICAPQSGIVFAGVLHNTVWGANDSFKKYLNWINVDVGHDEFYEIAHVSPLPSKRFFQGMKIKKGEPILLTALNGYITETDGVPDSHVHILVGKWLDSDRTKFTSLKIRWEN